MISVFGRPAAVVWTGGICECGREKGRHRRRAALVGRSSAALDWRLPLHAGGVPALRFNKGLTRFGIERVRAISTGQLHGLLRFHLRPIDVVVFHGSRRDLVLRGASRLDAFSGYPVRT